MFKTPNGTELPFLKLQGKNYLQVAHRILWFREEKPEWVISSRIVEKDNQSVIMEANILDESGRIRASAHKMGKVGPKDLEKVETGAIGRALAFLGYGTQFAEDLYDEGDEIADAPIPSKQEEPLLSEGQVKRLFAIALKNNYTIDYLHSLLKKANISDFNQFTKKQYYNLIDYLEKNPKTEASQVGVNIGVNK